jgi:hypothetical protein
MLKGTSKNRSYSSDATKLSANDSASFPFRFMDVHARAARDPHREQFFEVPLRRLKVIGHRGTKGKLKARFAAVRVRVADGPPQRIRDKGQQHLPGRRLG